MTENYDHITKISVEDVNVLMEKGKTYGSSWRNRGGVGAFMMLARKWDRIENIAKGNGYDIFGVVKDDVGGILDDIQDLRRYLLLVESYITAPRSGAVANPTGQVPREFQPQLGAIVGELEAKGQGQI